jgi:hypothetical protein
MQGRTQPKPYPRPPILAEVPSKVRLKFLRVLPFSCCLSALVVGKVEMRTGLREDETCAQKYLERLVTHTGSVGRSDIVQIGECRSFW